MGSSTNSPGFHATIERKAYGTTEALAGVALELVPGETGVILGPSGAGKTTLLRICSGLDRDFVGQIEIHGERIRGPSTSVGLMFQDSLLLPWLSVERNILFGAAEKRELRESIPSLLEAVGLDQSIRGQAPSTLSGGMARRVSLLRAIAAGPSVLLLDEPFSALDADTKQTVLKCIEEYSTSGVIGGVRVGKQLPMVAIVTHDIEEAAFLGDWVAALSATRPARLSTPLRIQAARPRSKDDSFRENCKEILYGLLQFEESVGGLGVSQR